MSSTTRLQRALAQLLPAGTLGASVALAAVQAEAAIAPAEPGRAPEAADADVGAQLDAIRREMSRQGTGATIELDADGLMVAQWVNIGGGGLGWRNGGWGNGGWRNAGWGNGGWHNAAWGNGAGATPHGATAAGATGPGAMAGGTTRPGTTTGTTGSRPP